VINMFVPRTDSDGNELGGMPVVLRDAPLGSYFGWNITATGFHKSQNCDYTGGYAPFAVTNGLRWRPEAVIGRTVWDACWLCESGAGCCGQGCGEWVPVAGGCG
jgi:hypothetical protein